MMRDVLFLMGLLLTPLALAQTDGEVAVADSADAPAAAPEPAAIALPDVLRMIERVDRRLVELQTQWIQNERTITAIRNLTDLVSRIDRYAAEMDQLDLDSVPQRQLTSLTDKWTNASDQLETWRERIENASTQLEASLDELNALESVWGLTLEGLRAQEALPALIADTEAVIGRISALRQQLFELREPVSAYGHLVYQRKVLVAEKQAQIASHISDIRDRIFSFDQGPIWAPHASAGETDQRRLTEVVISAVRQFASENQTSLVIQFFMLFIWVGLASIWRRHLKSLEIVDDPAVKRLGRWLRHPVMIGAYTGLLIALFYYSPPPVLVFEVLMMALLSISVFLLSRETPALLFMGVALIGAYVIETGLTQVVSPSIFARFMLILENILVLWVCIAGLKDVRKRHLPGPIQRLVRLIAHALPVIVGLALVANIFGSVLLSALLVRGTVNAVVAGIILITAVILLDGLMTYVLRARQARFMRSIRNRISGLERLMRFLLRAVAFILWAEYALEAFGLSEVVVVNVVNWMNEPWQLGNMSLAPGQVLGFIIVIVAAVVLARVVRLLLEEDLLANVDLPRGVPGAISVVARYTIITLGFLAALSVAGVQLTQIGIVIGALGVGIGLGLQNIVSNFVSGLILVFERPLQSGDMVQVGTTMGTVEEIGVRASRVRTFQGAEVIVPNSELISKEFTNWTLSDYRRRIDIPFMTDLKVRPREITQLLLEVAAANDNVAEDPAPRALFEGAEEGMFRFKLMAWVSIDNAVVTRSDLALAVHEAFEEKDIHLPDLPLRRFGAPTPE